MLTQLQGTKVEATVYHPGPQTYETELVPAIFRPWAERLVEKANLMAGERVLDIACGTGIVARTAASRVGPAGTVAGVDVNPAMLEVARSVASNRRIPIEFVESNAQSLPFPDASFDAAFCQQGLQFVTDRVEALTEAHRVLTPRGRAIFAAWRGTEHHPALTRVDEIMVRHLSPEYLEGSDAPFWLGDIDELRSLFHESGFGDVHIRSELSEVRFPSSRTMLDGLTGAHAPLAGAIAELSERQRRALYEDVDSAFATYRDDDGVMFSMTSAVVVART